MAPTKTTTNVKTNRSKVSTGKPLATEHWGKGKSTVKSENSADTENTEVPVKEKKVPWQNIPKPRFDPAKFFSCLKCDGIFKNNNKIGHCPSCCQTFSGSGTWDAHRKFPYQLDENKKIIPQGRGRKKKDPDLDPLKSDDKKVCINPAIQDKSLKWWKKEDQPGTVWFKGDKPDPELFKQMAANTKAKLEADAKSE